MAQTIAENVFRERRDRKWSRIHLAEQAGVGKTVIWDIEHAKPTVRLQTLIQVCGALDMGIQLTEKATGGTGPVQGISSNTDLEATDLPEPSREEVEMEPIVEELPDFLL